MSDTTNADSYQQTKAPPGTGIPHGAGNNPSTAAGLIVLIALAILAVMRRSFRRYL